MGLHLPSLNETDMLHCINTHSAIVDVSSKAMIDTNLNLITQIGCLETRTQQIFYFNKKLKEKISININKCKYIDINDELLDKNTNTCKQKFIANLDHHLIRNETGLVWFNTHLKSAF